MIGDQVTRDAFHALFDRAFLPDMGRPWLCSLRLARRLWPDAPSRSLQVLRYWLGVDRSEEAHQ